MIQLRTSLFSMVVVSFILQYYLMSYIMTDSTVNIKNSLGKLYVSTIMASTMGIIEVYMYDNMANVSSWSYYVPLVTILVASVIMYRQQKGVDENNYLNEMIEHHSMALLTSRAILEKTNDNQVKNLAQNIIKSQQSEINYMGQLLTKY
jgi:hypothetical protein